jgi:hypothetical protein
MVSLLFARLSPELRVFAIRKLGRFISTTILPSMIVEASSLVEAAARSDADAVVQHIVEPLLAQVEGELPGLAHASSGQLSKVRPFCCKPVKWLVATHLVLVWDAKVKLHLSTAVKMLLPRRLAQCDHRSRA